MPLSHIGMSIAQFGFGVAVLGGLNYREKIQRLAKNTTSLLWVGLFILFMLGGLHSEDSIYFWRDIRMKMPLWVFPVAIGSMPALSRIKFSFVLHAFLIGLYIHIALGLNVIIGQRETGFSYRDLSPMVSHIRMGLFLVTGIIIQTFLLFKQNKDMQFFNKWMYLLGILVFIGWLFVIKSLTALLVLLIIALIAGFYFAGQLRNRIKARILMTICWLPILLSIGTISFYSFKFFDREDPVFSEEPEYTKEGCLYESLRDQGFYENGHYVYDKFCTGELAREWEKRSQVSYFENGLRVHYTLLRYMTSKNYPKDAEGMAMMSDEDIRNVERGIPNYVYTNLFGIQGRIYETLWELEIWWGSGDAQGKSLATRFELWKSAYKIVRENPLAGVGTGDVRVAMQQAVYSDPNPIRYDKSYGAHNQFLTTAVAIGVYGMFWLFICVVYPLTQKIKYNPLLLFFIILTFCSMLNEDVFETQAAVTFVSFFFHIFNRPIYSKSN